MILQKIDLFSLFKQCGVVFFLISTIVTGQETKNSPTLFGYIRAINENSISEEKSYFNINHARLGVRGGINSHVEYRIFFDLARRSKILNNNDLEAVYSNLLLDAYISLNPLKNLKITVGQSKVPFSASNLRSPFGMDFIKRPQITKVTPSIRDVGIKVSLQNSILVDNTLSAGIFNGDGDNNFTYSKDFAYALRWLLKISRQIDLGASIYGGNLSGSDAFIYNLELQFKLYNSTLYGEYVKRKISHVTNDIYSDSYFISYQHAFTLDSSWLDAIKPNFRFEYFNSDLTRSNNKIVAGVTLSALKNMKTEFKVNYELYSEEKNSSDQSAIYLLLQTML